MRVEAAAFALAVLLLVNVAGAAARAAAPDSLGAPVDTLAVPAPPKLTRPSVAPT